ncbi:MAG: hypothetical protein MAG795_00548 [Candidatus Woesearchaeota archaeon]|nr:hypothetical protein [Candidatus Woesearchaeota archaeon]
MKLNVGCGHDIKKGWVNLDVKKRKGVDVVHNLEKYPYPFEDNKFNLILADNVLEHLDDTIGCMNELHRILKPGGKLILKFPYFQHPNAWVDPTHKKCLTVGTFRYFVRKKRKLINGKYVHNPVDKQRLFTKLEYKYHPTWVGYIVYPFIKWLRHFCDILILNVEVRLTK